MHDVPSFPRRELADLAEHFRLCSMLEPKAHWAKWSTLLVHSRLAYDALQASYDELENLYHECPQEQEQEHVP